MQQSLSQSLVLACYMINSELIVDQLRLHHTAACRLTKYQSRRRLQCTVEIAGETKQIGPLEKKCWLPTVLPWSRYAKRASDDFSPETRR